MYNIELYEDEHGNCEIKDFILLLKAKSSTNKHARINFNKVVAYLNLLEEMGTRVGEPVIKHLKGDLWELRPLANRILFAYYKNNTFILLHHFEKKTQKTPKQEIEKAIREYTDYKRTQSPIPI